MNVYFQLNNWNRLTRYSVLVAFWGCRSSIKRYSNTVKTNDICRFESMAFFILNGINMTCWKCKRSWVQLLPLTVWTSHDRLVQEKLASLQANLNLTNLFCVFHLTWSICGDVTEANSETVRNNKKGQLWFVFWYSDV